ncbi:unnamed protein product [Parajaminaea phylloscopi]
MLDRMLGWMGYKRIKSPLQLEAYRQKPRESLLEAVFQILGILPIRWPSPTKDPFYGLNDPETVYADHPVGTPLRVRSIELNYFPGIPRDVKAYHIAYVTSNEDGIKQVTVTTVVVPPGASMDRMVCQLNKTDAAVPFCRTSYGLRAGTGARFPTLSEGLFIAPFLAKQWIVNLPDYTGQFDAFGSGPIAGRATLDSIRAVLRSRQIFDGREAPQDIRVAVWGYSGGAHAAFWAANLQSAYAPDLGSNIVCWAGGGCPVDLAACGAAINSTFAAGLLIGMMTGLANVYPSFSNWLYSHLTATGTELFEAGQKCWPSYMLAGFQKDIITGPPNGCFTVADPLEAPPVRDLMQRMYLKLREADSPPSQPILLVASTGDEIVPIGQADELTRDWIKHKCTVDVLRTRLIGHVVLCFASFPYTLQWLKSRLDGLPLIPRPEGKPSQLDVEDDDDVLKLDDSQDLGDLTSEHLQHLRHMVSAHTANSWFE